MSARINANGMRTYLHKNLKICGNDEPILTGMAQRWVFSRYVYMGFHSWGWLTLPASIIHKKCTHQSPLLETTSNVA